jgi:hypothetical protein
MAFSRKNESKLSWASWDLLVPVSSDEVSESTARAHLAHCFYPNLVLAQ